MSNRIFDALLIEQISRFKQSFSGVSQRVFYDEDRERLIHTGEFGMFREAICKEFLRFFIPMRLDINQGFLINTANKVSTQCDIVVYDSSVTPLIQAGDRQRFFPVETVCAVGEVKSKLDRAGLKEALNKLARTKKLAEYVKNPSVIRREAEGQYMPSTYARDQIVTFLICQKIEGVLPNPRSLYDVEVEDRHRHNMILSIEDGLFLYGLNGMPPYDGMHAYPVMGGSVLPDSVMRAETHGDDAFRVFAHYLFQSVTHTTVLFPEMSDYMVYPSFGE